MNKWKFGFFAVLAMTIGSTAQSETGTASYYDLKGRTASGGTEHNLTAAHPTLPFGTKVRVTNLRNRRSVIVTINDRGPFKGKRIIDVSKNAADSLRFRKAGKAHVKVEQTSN